MNKDADDRLLTHADYHAPIDPNPAPATGETMRLIPRADARPLPALWEHLADTGIRLRPDFRRPDYWVAAVLTHQTAAHATREDATLAAIRWLIDEVQRQRTARERAERYDWWRSLFG